MFLFGSVLTKIWSGHEVGEGGYKNISHIYFSHFTYSLMDKLMKPARPSIIRHSNQKQKSNFKFIIYSHILKNGVKSDGPKKYYEKYTFLYTFAFLNWISVRFYETDCSIEIQKMLYIFPFWSHILSDFRSSFHTGGSVKKSLYTNNKTFFYNNPRPLKRKFPEFINYPLLWLSKNFRLT